jgi:hypothetical protein
VSLATAMVRRFVFLGLIIFGLAACGDNLGSPDGGAVVADGGICGTNADPGILEFRGLTPAMGAAVDNQAIVHGFTVVGAPADFKTFDFKYGPAHTAGLPTPASPRFTTTISGSDISYLLTIDSWSRSPGHVEFSASGGFTTSKNCSWRFPSPLFSYDITGGPDGGAAAETGGSLDGQAKPIDAAVDETIQIDAAGLDVAMDAGAAPLD